MDSAPKSAKVSRAVLTLSATCSKSELPPKKSFPPIQMVNKALVGSVPAGDIGRNLSRSAPAGCFRLFGHPHMPC